MSEEMIRRSSDLVGTMSAATPVRWSESKIRDIVRALREQVLSPYQSERANGAICVEEAVLQLARRPEIHAALCERQDYAQAVRDLATRCAFERLMIEGKPAHSLGPLYQALIQSTLDTIYKRAERLAGWMGENPLDEDQDLLLSLCRSLSRYIPRRPIGAFISWKLKRYEGAVSRAMRQVQHLVTRPEVTEPFVAFVLDARLPDEFKGELLNLARGAGRSGMNCEATMRFFALPGTLAFVKRFAGTVQTARTLYAEEEYEGIRWEGKRKLPDNRRQGYIDKALDQLERAQAASMDTEDFDLHEIVESERELQDTVGRAA